MNRNPEATCATCPYWAAEEPERYLSEAEKLYPNEWRRCCYDIPSNQGQSLPHHFCLQHPDFLSKKPTPSGGFAGRHNYRSTD